MGERQVRSDFDCPPNRREGLSLAMILLRRIAGLGARPKYLLQAQSRKRLGVIRIKPRRLLKKRDPTQLRLAAVVAFACGGLEQQILRPRIVRAADRQGKMRSAPKLDAECPRDIGSDVG